MILSPKANISCTTLLKRKGNIGSLRNVCHGFARNWPQVQDDASIALFEADLLRQPKHFHNVKSGSSSENNLAKSTTGPWRSSSSSIASILASTCRAEFQCRLGKRIHLLHAHLHVRRRVEIVRELNAAGLASPVSKAFGRRPSC